MAAEGAEGGGGEKAKMQPVSEIKSKRVLLKIVQFLGIPIVKHEESDKDRMRELISKHYNKPLHLLVVLYQH